MNATILADLRDSLRPTIAALDTTVTTDGSALGSSQQSRVKKALDHARYVAAAYLDNPVYDTWEKRRSYYGQVADSLRHASHEFRFGSVPPGLTAAIEEFTELVGPNGAAAEVDF